MRLVGATNTFVRLPYLIDGVLKGLAGGTIAALLSWAAVQLVSMNLMGAQFFSAQQVVLGIAAGGLLGLVGSWVSVGRHLRRVWRDA
jgi:cell division transport system permease protein